MLKLKVKYHTDGVEITKSTNGDWYDVRAAELVEMNRFDFRLIKLGFSLELPEGYEAILAPRSSTYKNFGIIMTNSIGIIDESYKGDKDEWKFAALCLKEHTIIQKGDRIAQFRIIKHQEEIKFLPVEMLENEERGGFGSTGIK